MLTETNFWLSCNNAKPSFSAPLAAQYEQRQGPARRRHLAMALVLTAIAVLTVALLDHANAPQQFAQALHLRIVSFTLCVSGALMMLRVKPGFQEAATYAIPLIAQMVLAVWVGMHGSPVMIDRNILGSLMLFAVLCAVPPVPGQVAGILSALLYATFILSFLVIAGPAMLWQHRTAAAAAAVALTVGAILSQLRDAARRRDFVQTLRAELTARELTRVNTEAERLMHTDVLTGVANRRRFEADMQAIWPTRYEGVGLGLLLVDVDHFKSFNDCGGHAAGDTCLRAIAGAIAGVVRGGAFSMARWGGEEFVVLAPGIVRGSMLGLGERVRCAVEMLELPHPAWPGRFVTVSVGAAWCGDGSLYDQPEDFLRSADIALYEAKSRGRNRVIGALREKAVLF